MLNIFLIETAFPAAGKYEAPETKTTVCRSDGYVFSLSDE